ncbi:MAG: YfaP family protein [Bacteroidales bacterium]
MKIKTYTRISLIFFFFLLVFNVVNAQVDKMLDIMEDEMTLEEEGLTTLRFFDALSGDPVEEAMISIGGIGEFATDGLGRVQFETPVEDGKYPFKFEKEGYITATYIFELIVGTVFYNRYTVSPVIDMGTIRLVLEWDRRPDDLDLHLQKTGGYHISYRSMTASNDGMARLDRDAMSGYGPETITVKDVDDNAEYICYVHDFSNSDYPRSKALSRAKARILVYGEGQLLQVFLIDEVQRGNQWIVFRLVNGQFITENDVIKVR